MYRFSRPTCYVFLLPRAASPCRDVDLELFLLAVDAAGAVLARVHEVDVAEDERLGDVAAFRRGPVHLQLAQVGEVCVVGVFRQRARLGFHNRTRLGVKVAHWLPPMAYMRSKAIV